MRQIDRNSESCHISLEFMPIAVQWGFLNDLDSQLETGDPCQHEHFSPSLENICYKNQPWRWSRSPKNQTQKLRDITISLPVLHYSCSRWIKNYLNFLQLLKFSLNFWNFCKTAGFSAEKAKFCHFSGPLLTFCSFFSPFFSFSTFFLIFAWKKLKQLIAENMNDEAYCSEQQWGKYLPNHR